MAGVEADPGFPHRCLARDDQRHLLHARVECLIAGQELWTVEVSLSRLNHWLPGREPYPKVVQGTAEFHHQIADALLPQTNPIFHDAAAFDTTVGLTQEPS